MEHNNAAHNCPNSTRMSPEDWLLWMISQPDFKIARVFNGPNNTYTVFLGIQDNRYYAAFTIDAGLRFTALYATQLYQALSSLRAIVECPACKAECDARSQPATVADIEAQSSEEL